jgi:hypothetical protein
MRPRTELSPDDFSLQRAFTVNLQSGTIEGRSRTFDNYPGDVELALALNGMQDMVHGLTGHNAYEVQVMTKDGKRRQAPVKYPVVNPVVDDGEMVDKEIHFAGAPEDRQTTAESFPDSVPVSDVVEFHIRMY